MRTVSLSAAVLSLAVLACTETPTDPEQLSSPIVGGVTPLVGSNVAVMINGQSNSNRLPSPSLTISARRLEDGSVSGRGHRGSPGDPGFQGPIEFLEDLGVDLWCLKFRNPTASPGQGSFFTQVIHDIGDGVNTFDELGGLGDFVFPSCSGVFSVFMRTVTRGNFRVQVFE